MNVVKQNLKNYILADALKCTLSGKSVEVLKTLKANGENAQVSWNIELKAWVVASKNVGIVVRSVSDINLYENSSFEFAIKIAR